MTASCGVDHDGLERVGDGIYREPLAGGEYRLHICIDELLELNGWPNVPENRAMLEDAIREVCVETFPGVPITSPYRGKEH